MFNAGETVDWLHAHGVGQGERLLSLARPEYVPTAEPALRSELNNLPEPVVYSVIVAQKWHDTLAPNVPLQYGLNTADGYDGGVLPLSRWLRLTSLVVAAPRADGVLLSRLETLPTERVLDLLGVRYLVANSGLPGRPGLPAVADFGDLQILARPSPVARDLVVFGATTAPNDSAALARMREASFDPNREVVLDDAQTPLALVAEPLPVTPSEISADHWRARIALPAAGYLLQREAWYPGWRARVDGVETAVLRADLLYRAVPLGAGAHDVEVFFDSATFGRGVWLSVGGLLLVALLLGLPIIRTRVRR